MQRVEVSPAAKEVNSIKISLLACNGIRYERDLWTGSNKWEDPIQSGTKSRKNGMELKCQISELNC